MEGNRSSAILQQHDRLRMPSRTEHCVFAYKVVRRGTRSAADTDPWQRLATVAADRTIPNLGHCAHLADVLRRVRQDHAVGRTDGSAGLTFRLRRRRNRESISPRGTHTFQALYALSGSLQERSAQGLLRRATRSRRCVSNSCDVVG